MKDSQTWVRQEIVPKSILSIELLQNELTLIGNDEKILRFSFIWQSLKSTLIEGTEGAQAACSLKLLIAPL